MRKLVAHTRRAASEAVFGSASRGTSDNLSDRDILIVDEDTAILRKRSMQLEQEGWSVAQYTFAKLEALSEKGALFVQHLKLEGAIQRDEDGRLESLLEAFKPRNDYSEELRENAKLAQLSQLVVHGPRGALLAADILYVAARNFGVLWLAQKGRYHFAYEEILQALQEENVLADHAASALTKLRFLKCLYRSGEREAYRAFGAVNEALGHLPKTYFPSCAIRVAPTAVIAAKPPPAKAPAYLTLRDLERRLVAVESLLGPFICSDKLSKLSRWIANPRAYSSLSAKLAPSLRLELEQCTVDLVVRAQLADIEELVGNHQS